MAGREKQTRFFYGYVITACSLIIWFIGWGTFTCAFSLFLKPLTEEFGWSRADMSIGYSLAFLVLALTGVGMGWLTDRFGPRIVVGVLGSFLGVSYLLLSQVHALWQFQVAFGVLGGIGAASIEFPVMVTMARWFIRKRNSMLGITQVGMGLGGLLFPPFAGWLIVAYGWRSTYLTLGIVTVLGIGISGFFLTRDPSAKGQVPDGVSDGSEAVASAATVQRVGLSLREALGTSGFWLIAVLYCAFGFCRSSFLAHVPAHVQDLGFTLADGANVIGVIIGCSILGRVAMGRIADRIGSTLTFQFSFFLTGVSMIVGLLVSTLAGVYVFALVFGVAWGSQAVLRFSVASEAFGLASLGLLAGTLGIAEAGAAMFGSYYAGWLFDSFGSYNLLFWSGMVTSLAAVLLAGRLARMKGREKRAR